MTYSDTKETRRGALTTLEAGRALAALMVVAFHANGQSLPERIYYDGSRAWAGYDMGNAGVEFFFVLSGFIMMYVHRQDFGRPARALPYLRRRAVRILPIYWIVLSALILAYALTGAGPSDASNPLQIGLNYLLVPSASPMILPVAWTLSHEMLFYFMFLFVIVNFQLGLAALVVFFGAAIIGLFFDIQGVWPRFLTSHYNLLFAFGMIAAFYKRDGKSISGILLGIMGLTVFFAIGLSDSLGAVEWTRESRTIALGAAAAIAVNGLAGDLRGPAILTRLLIFLGAASYSIYLIHLPFDNFVARALGKVSAGEYIGPEMMIWLVILIGVLAGSILHIAVEKPVIIRFRRTKSGPVAA